MTTGRINQIAILLSSTPYVYYYTKYTQALILQRTLGVV